MEPLELLTALNLAEELFDEVLHEVLRAAVIRAMAAATAEIEAEQLEINPLEHEADIYICTRIDRSIQFEQELRELGLIA